MFDWFWNFLYLITKSIFNLIDSLMICANMLCGIDPIIVDDEEVSFINYLLYGERVSFGFKVAALIGILLVGFFSLFAIIRSIVSEKSNTTPGQVFGKAVKTVLMFLFVPVCMFVLVYFTNIFMEALYAATLGGNQSLLGNFLCGAFSQNALHEGVSPDFYLETGFNYLSTECVRSYIDLTEFDFFFSWVSGVCILFALAQALLMFVDRAISIVILYIVAPISMSATVLDDGAHFKLWRDQILVKFLTGYGCILALNIYMLIISMISADNVVFIPGSTMLNNIAKIAFILGGAISMQRAMALIGNLVSAGAGSNELRDNAIASAGFSRAAGRLGSALVSPFKAIRGTSNFIRDTSNHGWGYSVGSRLGFKTDRDYGIKTETQQRKETESKRREHEQLASLIGDKVSNVLGGGGNGNGGNGGSGNRPGGNGGNAGAGVALQNSGEKKVSPVISNAVERSVSGSDQNNSSNKK